MRTHALFLSLIIITACSDAPVEEQRAGTEAAIEKQIEGDAKSLEAAADEAVNVLQSKIEKELEADGVLEPVATQEQTDHEQTES